MYANQCNLCGCVWLTQLGIKENKEKKVHLFLFTISIKSVNVFYSIISHNFYKSSHNVGFYNQRSRLLWQYIFTVLSFFSLSWIVDYYLLFWKPKSNNDCELYLIECALDMEEKKSSLNSVRIKIWSRQQTKNVALEKNVSMNSARQSKRRAVFGISITL